MLAGFLLLIGVGLGPIVAVAAAAESLGLVALTFNR